MWPTNDPDYVRRRKNRHLEAEERERTDQATRLTKSNISALATLLKDIRRERREQNEFERKKLPIDKMAAGAAIVAVALSLGSLIAFICLTARGEDTAEKANAILAATNRAWVTFTDAELQRSVDDPSGPLIIGHFQNVGATPALDVVSNMTPTAFATKSTKLSARGYPQIFLGWDAVGNEIIKACKTVSPHNGTQTIFPTKSVEGNFVSPMIHPFSAKAIDGGVQVVLLYGCFAYNTIGGIRHTAYCKYMSRQRSGSWEFLDCPSGNYAE